jgi:MFS family permease
VSGGAEQIDGGELPRGAAMRFVVFLGVVSLLADVTYEGMRAIVGPYLATLGATGAMVGLVSGAGELAGYVLRLASGYLTDRTRGYWLLTILGYSVNLAAVPLLGFAPNWPVAGALIVTERTGKAIRTPARDVMLSYAARRVGTGWAFGLHGAMDQAGAVAGPLMMAAILGAHAGPLSYRTAFGVLAVPACAAIAVLMAAARTWPHPAHFESAAANAGDDTGRRGMPAAYWLVVAGAAMLAFGFTDFSLAAYHWKRTGLAGDAAIPVLYALAMGADGLGSLALGRIIDRVGMRVLPYAAITAIGAAPLMFGVATIGPAALGLMLWAAGLGATETAAKSVIARLIPKERRGSAFGIYHAIYGTAWFAGSVSMGALYDRAPGALIGAAVCAQALAVPVLAAAGRRARGWEGRSY